MMAPSSQALAREVFEALRQNDTASLQILLSPDAVLHVPGQNPNAGEYWGYQGFLDFWERLSKRTAGKFEVRIQDVLANEQHATVIGVNGIEREGERLEHRVVYVLRISEGRVAECWIHNYDQHRVDAFWQ